MKTGAVRRESLRDWLLIVLMWLITKVERHRDRRLAAALRGLADLYDPDQPEP